MTNKEAIREIAIRDRIIEQLIARGLVLYCGSYGVSRVDEDIITLASFNLETIDGVDYLMDMDFTTQISDINEMSIFACHKAEKIREAFEEKDKRRYELVKKIRVFRDHLIEKES